ncbi:type II toxin-antitoxin system VapC family toxin [Halopiger goleimassiliensis]|uniref:type II toxin-antitoxin system VapC family toxin n=1 Tax=Halopiger goleimassiliensis TaxID=1293048 RepID=UPI000B0179A8|nr:type II toxin-antitoxin system VapC family toxin [Halopiger goleimassiliensis]
MALFEAYRGEPCADGSAGVQRVASGLDWADPLPLTEPMIREAAVIEAELLEAGERVNLDETLIAGICRHNGAQVVTRDGHFEQIPDLDVQSY